MEALLQGDVAVLLLGLAADAASANRTAGGRVSKNMEMEKSWICLMRIKRKINIIVLQKVSESTPVCW